MSKFTIHRDHSVSYWDIYQQRYVRRPITSVFFDAKVMASLSEDERKKVLTRWQKVGSYDYFCSNCGQSVIDYCPKHPDSLIDSIPVVQ